jgi:hypothetical protein
MIRFSTITHPQIQARAITLYPSCKFSIQGQVRQCSKVSVVVLDQRSIEPISPPTISMQLNYIFLAAVFAGTASAAYYGYGYDSNSVRAEERAAIRSLIDEYNDFLEARTPPKCTVTRSANRNGINLSVLRHVS